MADITPEEVRNEGVVRRMLDVFNTGDVAVLDEIIDINMVSHNPHPGTANNREGLKQQILFLRKAFPDARFEEESIVVEGDKAFLRWAMVATDRGGYMGNAPTNRPIVHHGQEFLRLRNGSIIEHHGEESDLEFRGKLGLRPGEEPRPADASRA